MDIEEQERRVPVNIVSVFYYLRETKSLYS